MDPSLPLNIDTLRLDLVYQFTNDLRNEIVRLNQLKNLDIRTSFGIDLKEVTSEAIWIKKTLLTSS